MGISQAQIIGSFGLTSNVWKLGVLDEVLGGFGWCFSRPLTGGWTSTSRHLFFLGGGTEAQAKDFLDSANGVGMLRPQPQ